MPKYLQHDIDALLKGIKESSSVLDCLYLELNASINVAEVDEDISEDAASYLRNKYLYGKE